MSDCCKWQSSRTGTIMETSLTTYQEAITTYGVQHQMNPTTMVMVRRKVRCRALWICDKALQRSMTVPLLVISLSSESLCWRLERLEISQTIAEYAMLMMSRGTKYMAIKQNQLYADSSIALLENDSKVTHCRKPGNLGCTCTWKKTLCGNAFSMAMIQAPRSIDFPRRLASVTLRG